MFELFSVMRRVDGARFNGHLTSSQVGGARFAPAYRVLLVRNPCFLQPGDTILSHNGEVIILMEAPDDHPWAKSFKAVYAQNKLAWSRKVTVIDPISKVPKDNGYTSLGTLYVNFDEAGALNFQGLQDTEYRFITGQDVHVGDKVGAYTVKRIETLLGVKVVHVT